uniref:Uncharacterized protein n=1 Tax=viral metagenome TaxID=1070528 RepID=A0A6H1ZJL9_9ZZZZ
MLKFCKSNKRLSVFITALLAVGIFATEGVADNFRRDAIFWDTATFKKGAFFENVIRQGKAYIPDWPTDAITAVSSTTAFKTEKNGILQHNIFLIDPSAAVSRYGSDNTSAISGFYTNGAYPASYNGSGVTVLLPGLKSTDDDVILTYINLTGSTSFYLYEADGGINTSSGTTHGAGMTSPITLDAIGDSITVLGSYNGNQRYSGVSWFVLNWNAKEEYYFGNSATITYDTGYADKSQELSGTTTGYTGIDAISDGKVFYVDQTNNTMITSIGDKYSTIGNGFSGLTVSLPTVTDALDGWELTITKVGSGTTEIVPYGTAVGTASGTTPGDALSTLILNAVGDSITLQAACNSEVSWFVKSSFIQ